MNADEVYEAIKRRHQLPEWILVRELRIGTGYDYRTRVDRHKWIRAKALQQIDAYALNCYPSENFRKIAYEIKVSRSDFMAEKMDPDKRIPAMEVSDYFYFAAPRGLIAPMEIPKDCGLLVVYETGQSEILKEAPRLEATRLDWRFVASLVRNVTRMQKKDLPRDVFTDPRPGQE